MSEKTSDKGLGIEALRYHSEGRPGKIEVIPTKPYSTQSDLALAYSPGVAVPCLEIEKNAGDAYKYTAKGNLVAVISNGTAVLGLGNIGPLAGKPVMEGKGILFKTFADIDVFDIEVDATDVDKFIETVKNIAPTFGGINLEDIKAPECFAIEQRLKEELDIPVMHDDQHGTAIISAAALLNALEITGRKIEKVKVVVNGAGAAAVSCARLYKSLGVKAENMLMCDSKGVLNLRRPDLNTAKKEFAADTTLDTLEDAVKGADVFLGLSVADVLTADMVRSMAADPIVFALANPDPEISYKEAMASRPDIIFATGRSDYPNQVNNVLGFPYIFRGALDVRATAINEQMKIAAVHALAALTREPVPESVASAYSQTNISFGRDYLIPKPLDPRLLVHISTAVAKAAIESGVAAHEITDWDAYQLELEKRMGRDNKLMRRIRTMVATAPRKRIVFSNGENTNVIKAASVLAREKLVTPILVGDAAHIRATAEEQNVDIASIEIIDHASEAERPRRERYGKMLHERLQRKGMSLAEATFRMGMRQWFTLMVTEAGDADGAIVDYSRRYTRALEPVREIFDLHGKTLAGMHIVSTKKGAMFFTDTVVNPNPSARELADITVMAAQAVRHFGYEPVVAMLSNSNFGTDTEPDSVKVAGAVKMLHESNPDLLVEGEMKADTALDVNLRREYYPFNRLGDREVNTLIFPTAASANIAYKMMNMLGDAELTGPVLLGLWKDVHLQSETADQRSVVNLALIAASNNSDLTGN
ncbi:MAG: NADP-dependent malic enzyme [Alistipes sp.]|jgi:malate dehydrogenase (oxaloacetate-decarboxylating)(NADP+)|nr:NADP-dependent malic enzyme [Alistipes sp.]